ncbi:ABC transporter ATP-binding protein [Noviherbaspirillum autotrophicum]|uniref:Copper ABC transporter ATP-binding protein NosF n=1 Tax=Noviherbaspirillum autotrophicum TaxID=709839 RepID=A0A0C2BTT7_9BURK|nr:ABC transporter ATP-binding protein [Noviherbaspirillum autotrophicum]KIF81446.1 copper ABC transporter ATP-binding protein NosF [Noviherbaspirillum autotrophicum]
MASLPIEVKNVSKRYGDVQAVDGVSLSVERGEMIGLIGHNGAGKSTLFKLMLGLIPATSGAVLVSGVPIDGRDFRAVRRRIGYLPETFVTYDNLTGMEVLRLFADLKQVPRSACDDVLARVGLADAAKRRVRGYSKGMRQRLGFAQVLLGSPDLIFLDEPTNGLDPEGIHDFYQILHEVKAQGATIIITSHILAEIQERVDRLVILNSGRIAAQGTLAQLRAQMVLPSEIRIQLRSGQGSRVHDALASLAGLELKIEQDCVRVSCLPGQKVAVLNILAALADTVHDIAIHEPSLEDLFLGYGGLHGRKN